MRVLSRSYNFSPVREPTIEMSASRAAAGMVLMGLGMAAASLAGAIIGGSPVVAKLPSFAADGGVGTMVAAGITLGLGVLLGRTGWHAWQARIS